ncbi:hypothetical protein VTI74DRAFT_9244 [Chaetomium olivicolor]
MPTCTCTSGMNMSMTRCGLEVGGHLTVKSSGIPVFWVLAAFLASAIFTITAVLVAYLSGSLDDEFMDDVDREVTKWSRAKGKKLVAPLRKIFGHPVSSPSSTTDSDRDLQVRKSEARKQAVTQFILILSDQQLVTGMAILISGIVSQNQLTSYQFSVVLSLAWFSSTTHLATLDVLRIYLRTHSTIRMIRVIGMIVVLVLLIYAFAVANRSYAWSNKVPVQCLFTHGVRPIPNTLIESSFFNSWFANFSWSMALVLIIYEYLTRIWELYFNYGLLARFRSRFSLRKALYQSPLLLTALKLSPDEYREVYDAAIRFGRMRMFMSVLPPLMYGGFFLIDRTFLSSFTVVAFSLSYGLSQVALFRWLAAPELDEESRFLGFGQIMALALLILPFMAAGECYYDYVEKRTRFTTSSSQAPAGSTHSPDRHATEYPGERETSVTQIDEHSDSQIVRAEYSRSQKQLVKYFALEVYTIRQVERHSPEQGGIHRELLDEIKKYVVMEHQKLKLGLQDTTTARIVTVCVDFIIPFLFAGGVVPLASLVLESASPAPEPANPILERFSQSGYILASVVLAFLVISKILNAVGRILTMGHAASAQCENILKQLVIPAEVGEAPAVELERVAERTVTGLMEEGRRRRSQNGVNRYMG